MSSIGSTCAYPPPVAPPFTPNTGPKEGSRKAMTAFFPILCIAWPKPVVVVVLPSPAGVGLMAVTKINLPSCLFSNFWNNSSVNFALYLPYGS